MALAVPLSRFTSQVGGGSAFFVRRMSTFATMFKSFLKIPLFGKIALATGILSNGVVIALSIPFFAVPHGSGIRPMAWAAFMFMIAFWALVVGLPSSIISFRSCSRRVSIVSLILSLSPLPLAVLLLHSIATICGFELEP